MARRDRPADDGTELRRYLVAEAEEFRRTVCDIALGDPAMADYAWREMSKPVDQLAAGQAYRSLRDQCGVTPKMYAKQLSKSGDLLADEQAFRLYRWELPDWCSERWVGELNDLLVLTADDKLVYDDDYVAAEAD